MIYYQDDHVTLHLGDCLDVMRELGDASVDSVVTDPPYGLEFMGKDWDGADGFRRSLNAADVGRESVFGRTSAKSPEYRTDSKATASAAQRGGHSATDGRPTFLGGLNPKCLVCGRWQRGLNPCACDAPEWTQERLVRLHVFQAWCEEWARECLRVLKPGGHLLAFGGSRTWHRLAAAVEDAGFEIRDSIAWLYGSGFPKSRNLDGDWQGWGTALKPAFEPIVMGRKPLDGTVAGNVLAHGTGALNIDACRIGDDVVSQHGRGDSHSDSMSGRNYAEPAGRSWSGRWPANVVLGESQAAELDRQSGVRDRGRFPGELTGTSLFGLDGHTQQERNLEGGGASRFFYVAKAGAAERPKLDGSGHPTVKPLDLMRWLIRLVTPPGGTVLEPFLGSGTTAEACIVEGFRCIGIEREPKYMELAKHRLSKPISPVLDFGVGA